ncbi:hypothetical protein MIMGU_mgv1a024031mg [Erythranthe guttata]|uniref:Uncharacterized protein n=1 Tax=Erythranthe guttata TaxID=4155 RepID=A0A022Q084_ERYGU|nr:PREDICTED: uncharacterized protein LOC105975708 [Erythranthe guttata]EYU21194.1 hypothetical protein MIMGU_mgv1a024031mg [Erythranthe guttata]|eukprot:XP_012856376.1 PREDICTED: uncharacterized protein LOC105975708 [Erythranthe guttata]
MDSSSRKSSSNKIRDIVRLQQILKKWKKLASNNRAAAATATTTTTTTTGRSIKFLKKTLSFSESTTSGAVGNAVPKGYIAVCVGKEMKRYVIPTEYLSHQMFGILLREAEEEFGFQQEGVLKFPCEVELFDKIIKMMMVEDKRPSSASPTSSSLLLQHDNVDVQAYDAEFGYNHDLDFIGNYSPEDAADQLTPSLMMCR